MRVSFPRIRPGANRRSRGQKAALAAARTQHEADRAVLDADKAAFLRESTEARAKLKAEAQALADQRTKLVAIRGEIEGGVKLREAEVRKTNNLGATSFPYSGLRWAELKWSLTIVGFRSMTVPILISLSRIVWAGGLGEFGAGERKAPDRFHERVRQAG